MLLKNSVYARYNRLLFIFVYVSAVVSLVLLWWSVNQPTPLSGNSLESHARFVVDLAATMVPYQLLADDVWNDRERVGNLTHTIDMSKLRLQRLKPWATVEILGGELCPIDNSLQKTYLYSGNPFPASIRFGRARAGNDPATGYQCPDFVDCNSAVLQEIAFCNIKSMDNLDVIPFRPSKSVHGSVLDNLPYTMTSLSWKGQLIRLSGGSYIDNFGHAFNRNRQYMHGGCQDIPDRQNGGFKMFNASADVKVRTVDRALNLVHLHGNNFYHFIVEVLPRFFLSKSLIRRFPGIPIYIKSTPFLHLLTLIGIDPQLLNIRYIDKATDLIFVEKYQYFPLAARCLHAPSSLWKSIRKTFIDNVQSRFVSPISSVKQELVKNIVYISREHIPFRRHVHGEAGLLSKFADSLKLKQGDDASYFHSDSFTFKVLYGNEPMNDTLKALSIANTVIGPHGAGLANMVFAPRLKRIIEFAAEGYWNPCFFYLANGIGVDHYLMRVNGSHNAFLYLNQTNVDDIARWLVKKKSKETR